LRFDVQLGDSSYDYDAIDLLLTEKNGGQAGDVTPFEKGKTYRPFVSESEDWFADTFGAVYILSTRKYNNAELRIRNASTTAPHFFNLNIGSASGDCRFAENISLEFPDSLQTAYIPITDKGDVGPIAWDLDDDGMPDYYESLVYEPSVEQYSLLFQRQFILFPQMILKECGELLPIENQLDTPMGKAVIAFCKTKIATPSH
jgi:hypothetical protein